MSRADDLERLVDDLLEAGVFDPAADDELRLTAAFRREREERRRAARNLEDEFESEAAEYTADGNADPSDLSPETLGDAMAVYRLAEHLDREQSLLAAEALERLESATDRHGVPEGFVELQATDIDAFMANHAAAVIYCWRNDCDPCDGAKEVYEALLADGEIPDWVGLAAVFGPESPAYLRDQYDVGVAPTTLFCVDGEIDSRIVGNPGYEAFRTEVATITELAD